MNRFLILMLAVVVASGCADAGTSSSGNGLAIEEFSISDNTLQPEQQANLQVILKNYNENPTTLNEISIVNEGELEVSGKQCSSDEIRAAREDLYPQISCSWTVTAPGQEFVEGFDSKNTPLKLRLDYSTEFENSEPLKVNFQPLSDIESSETRSISFSNGEVSVTAEAESPSSIGSPENIQITAQNSGPGNVEGDYNFSYSPPEPFDCPSSQTPVVDEEVEFSCPVESGTEGVRNLFITTSYKYIKSPNLDISVVNNQ